MARRARAHSTPANLRWRPGVKVGVRPGSWSHLNEWFGPVLGVMIAENLDEAIAWQNQIALRPHGWAALAQPSRVRTLDRTRCRRQPLRRSRHDRRRRATPTLRRLEALERRPDGKDRWRSLRRVPSPLEPGARRRRGARGRCDVVARVRWAGARRRRARRRTEPRSLPSAARDDRRSRRRHVLARPRRLREEPGRARRNSRSNSAPTRS